MFPTAILAVGLMKVGFMRIFPYNREIIFNQWYCVMKPIAYPLFLLLAAGLSACGQKGPLFLADEQTSETEKPIIVIDNPNADIQPDFVEINPLIISGQLTELNENTAAGWEAVLAPVEESSNLIRYVVFMTSPIAQPTPTFSMLIGNAQKKIIKGQTRKRLTGGNYLRFRSLERGVDQIPTLINRVNSYLAANPHLKQGSANDFIIENEQLIDLYISVENTKK